MKNVSCVKLLTRLAVVFLLCLTGIALTAALAYADNDNGAPYIRLSPGFGVPGTEVTVRGYYFEPDDLVHIFYAGVPMTAEDVGEAGTFTATFDVPASPRGPHRVEADVDGAVLDAADFYVWPGLTVRPAEGQAGDTVTVTGRGYGRDETGIELYFGGQRVIEDIDIVADFYGSWTETVQIPPSVGGSHTLDTQPSAHRPPVFTVIPGIDIEEPSGSAGQTIEVSGSGFSANERGIRILFDGTAVPTVPADIWADDRGRWEASFGVPEMPSGEYIVTAEGDRTVKEDVVGLSFNITPGIVLSPKEGHVGMNVTVTGSGFAIDDEVIIMYEGDEVATTTTDDTGGFEAVFTVPRSKHGEREVKAEDTDANEAAAIFTMESNPPPTPELISPSDGARVGFAFNVRPRFEWSEVEDPSGVYYSLQISASANITAEGDFVDPIFSTEGLVGGNYTLEKAEALPHGTYYWIVRAVDGAENESDWTEVYSFQAGRLPLWAFIVIIVFIVVVIGTLVYFRVVRRRLYD